MPRLTSTSCSDAYRLATNLFSSLPRTTRTGSSTIRMTRIGSPPMSSDCGLTFTSQHCTSVAGLTSSATSRPGTTEECSSQLPTSSSSDPGRTSRGAAIRLPWTSGQMPTATRSMSFTCAGSIAGSKASTTASIVRTPSRCSPPASTSGVSGAASKTLPRGRSTFRAADERTRWLARDGRLVPTPPSTEPADAYVYEPLVPTWVAGPQPFLPVLTLGPHDQRPVERFNNVLVYTTEPREQELEVCGRPKLHLWISSTAPDTDFIAKLVDVHPDGYAQLVCLAPLRARFRHSLAEPRPLVPNVPSQFEMPFPLVCHTFRPRHAIRLEIASSCFPLLDRNPNTGTSAWRASPTEFRTATQTVFHDAEHPSRIILPV